MRPTSAAPIRRPAVLTAALVVTALALSGCVAGSANAPGATGSTDSTDKASSVASAGPSPTPSAATATKCNNVEQSYSPVAASFSAGSLQAEIKARKRLVVGVSADNRLLGARNPVSGKIEGFDIDFATEVAKAIFGPGGASNLDFKVITAAQRIKLVNAGVAGGGVDLVARSMTMTCDRWTQVGFSSSYFRAALRLLVKTNLPDSTTIDSLAKTGASVCAPNGSTGIDALRKVRGIVAVGAAQNTDCLALFQEGQVDAICNDDSILAGLVAQDPYAKVVGPSLANEPLGLAVSKQHPEFVQFINGVLDRAKADGTWAAAYNRWLEPALKVPAVPPAPSYGRPLP